MDRLAYQLSLNIINVTDNTYIELKKQIKNFPIYNCRNA